MDRVVLGQHANASIGAGLYVSKPGANVMHPEYAQGGNLMFDTNESFSSFNVIQNGTFKITCSRKAISARGETIGNRLNDTQELLDIEIGSMLNDSDPTTLLWVKYDDANWPTQPSPGESVQFDYTQTLVGTSGKIEITSASGPVVLDYTDVKFYPSPPDPAAVHEFVLASSYTGPALTQFDKVSHVTTAHTFAVDTGRPSNLTTVANWDEAKTPGYHNKSHGRPTKGKQSNYLDTGSQTIQITSPLPNGEIPKVALRFAVGNSSGHFHPWYANVSTFGSRGNWDEWTYNDSKQIVHMDSNWMRLKWGGLGAEEYMGIQDEYLRGGSHKHSYATALANFFHTDAVAGVPGAPSPSDAAAAHGFASAADMETKLKNSKLLSSAINNSQGIVGLIPYVNATSITVDAYMSPTHAGLRQPVDRTYEKNKGRQKGVGFNAIDDYAHINFPMESHPHTKDLTDAQISEDLNARKFKHLPGIPLPGDIYRDDGGDFDLEDHGKRDMFGWGGHPTEFFVNPFSNGNCTFYTHMQPPYLAGSFYPGNRVNGVPDASWDPAYYSLTEPRGYNPNDNHGQPGMAWGGAYTPAALLGPYGNGWGHYYATESGSWGPWALAHTLRPFTEAENEDMWNGIHPGFTGALAGTPVTVGSAPNIGDPIGTAGTPSRSVFNGAGIKWPAGHYHADYLDYRDWTGSMGLDGAGSKESLAKEDVWDTFYVSYTVYSTGSVPPPEAALRPGAASPFTSAGKAAESVPIWNPGYLGVETEFEKGESWPSVINNVVFPDDFVGTVGDPATDPFADRRDAFGKIYSNFHFNLDLAQGKNYGSDKFSTTTGKPLPVFTLDFSEDKWNYTNSKIVSVAINNSARIVGGGGAGGMGVRDHTVVAKSGDVSGGGFGGGGGGGGAGTGRNLEEFSFSGYGGNGFPGGGWPHEDPALAQFDVNIHAEDGTQGSRWDVGGAGGAKAQLESITNINNATYISHSLTYGHGSDGGDIFEVKHPAGIQPIISINNSDTGTIVSGGGGGAGGYEVDGSSGGAWGGHGQGTSGPTAYTGGNPGYVVTSENETYTRPVYITNISNGIVMGRNPQIPSHNTSNTSGGIAGGWLLTGNNTVDSTLPGNSFYRMV